MDNILRRIRNLSRTSVEELNSYDLASNLLTRNDVRSQSEHNLNPHPNPAVSLHRSYAYTYDGLFRMQSSDQDGNANTRGDRFWKLDQLGNQQEIRRGLVSTNAIENSFRNTRRKLGRVTRFRAEIKLPVGWPSR